MRLDRLYFTISTITVAWGLLAFAAASGSIATGLILLLAMGAALVVTTGERGRPAPRWFTSVLAVGAMVYALGGVLGGNESTMILHVARTVAALQIVKMLEPRTPRNQAQLLALSGMLTIGSCLTSVGFRMAVALSVYGPLMLASVMLFQLFRAERYASEGTPITTPARTDRAALAGVRSVAIVTGIGIAAVASAAFIVMPRGILEDSGVAPGTPSRSVSGFSEQVRLGGEGFITDSEVVVMEVQTLEHDGDSRDDWKPTQPEVLYLRGAVLDDYAPDLGIWTRSEAVAERDDRRYQNPRYRRQLFNPPESGRADETFVQIITVRSRSTDHLFALARPRIGGIVFDQNIEEFTFNLIDRTFSLPRRRGLFSYTVRSSSGGDISPESPASFPVDGVREYALGVLDREGLERDPGAVSTPEDRRIIRLFERHLRNNPDFTYTRDMTPPARGADPIVDFLRESRSGHCEYFASALAAMCRSIGIHARVITGYAAAEYNVQAGAFVVRESNAHAWVEAMTAPGEWETFDPSPAEEVRYGRSGPTGFRAVWINLNESVRFLWLKWVVGFGEHDQVNIFRLDEGGPFGVFARIKSGARSLGIIPDDPLPKLTPERMMRAGLAALATSAGVLGFLYGLHWLLLRFGVLSRLAPARRSRRRRGRTLYDRMLSALDRAGLAKPDSLPPLAFARRLETIDASVSEHVRAIAAWYYAGRFGNARADDRAAGEHLEALRARLRERG